MIRFPQALEGIEASIGQAWLDKARSRTQIFQTEGCYVEERTGLDGKVTSLPPFWGDIKEIYIERQHGKCVYCESKLERGGKSRIQWDLEHFRPKRNVRAWPSDAQDHKELREKYKNVFLGGAGLGYHMLAYSHLNYAAACKACNSPYKSDYFPVAAPRIQAGHDPSTYAGEKPYLVYPIGSSDVDPVDLIAFDGVEAKPRPDSAQDPSAWLRASIVIDFFELNRDGLHELRALWLYWSIWPNVKLADTGDAEAVRNLQLARTERLQHSNCSACFIDLCALDRKAAETRVEVFMDILGITAER